MKVRKYERKLTPSGYSDNGIWVRSLETVDFPACKLKGAIVETIKLKSGTGHGSRDNTYFDAFQVTIDGKSWKVNLDPRSK